MSTMKLVFKQYIAERDAVSGYLFLAAFQQVLLSVRHGILLKIQ
jgi:hypothetical protein